MDSNENPLTFLEISRPALLRNAEAVVESVGVPVIGVVKCGGYGVSVTEAARAWHDAGATMLGVSLPREAVELRQAGFVEDILLMCPVADEGTLNKLREMNVIVTVTGAENARQYCRWANGDLLRVHVAVDTGMGRFGVRWTDREQLREIYSQPGLSIEGIFSHFAKSYEKEYRQTRLQLERFLPVTGWLEEKGYPVGLRHIANSCAALRFPETRLDAVRAGSALVGRLGAPVPVKLEEAAVLKARVVDRRVLRPGDTTGYGFAFRVRRETDVAVVAIGYDSGFGYLKEPDRLGLPDLAGFLLRTIRSCRRSRYVVFSGKRLKVVGRIGTQYTLFDAAGTDIRPGDFVTARANLLFPGQKRVFPEQDESVEAAETHVVL